MVASQKYSNESKNRGMRLLSSEALAACSRPTGRWIFPLSVDDPIYFIHIVERILGKRKGCALRFNDEDREVVSSHESNSKPRWLSRATFWKDNSEKILAWTTTEER